MTTRGNESTYPVIHRMIQDGNNYKPEISGGITIREHFAGLAMQGLIAGRYSALAGNHIPVPSVTAAEALAHADALLAELAKEQK